MNLNIENIKYKLKELRIDKLLGFHFANTSSACLFGILVTSQCKDNTFKKKKKSPQHIINMSLMTFLYFL